MTIPALRTLHVHEIEALLQAAQAESLRTYAIVQTLVQTGICLSECVALTLGDLVISEHMGQITIRSGNGTTQRSMPAHASVCRALAEYLAPHWHVPPTVQAVVAVWHDRPAATPLWTGQRGTLTVRSIARMVEGLVAPLARCGLIPAATSTHTARYVCGAVCPPYPR